MVYLELGKGHNEATMGQGITATSTSLAGSAGGGIRMEGVTKSYGPMQALKGIDLELAKGEFLAVFGPNGSGKTTLIRILATLTRPTSGRVIIGGYDLRDKAGQARSILGVVTHQPLLYEDLTAYENLAFYGRMYGVPNVKERIHAVVEQVGMTHRLHDKIRTLSHGMQKRFAIARAILHDPSVLLMDEPESGLDQDAILRLQEIIEGLSRQGRTVVMVTHNLGWGARLGSQVLILKEGKVAFRARCADLDAEFFTATYARLTEAKS